MNAQIKPATLKAEQLPDHVLQVRKIGNSLGLIFPKELLAKLGLDVGDKLDIVSVTDRSINLKPHEGDRARKLALAREIMREYDDTMRELAK
jgi:putative addiction module antidote